MTHAQQRALDWQTNPPREHACSICGATGPVLSIGDTDAMHTRFAARCDKHIEAKPRLRKYYGIVTNFEIDAAQLDDLRWFQSNPDRTTRLRLSHACEMTIAGGLPILVRKNQSGQCVRIAVVGPFDEKLTDKELSDIHIQLVNQYCRTKNGLVRPNGYRTLKTGGA